MFKLLTEEEKHRVRREYLRRRTVVIFISLISVLAIGIIGFLPSYILSNLRYRAALDWDKVIANSSLKKDETELQKWLAETNRRLSALSYRLDVDRPSNFIKKVLDQKVGGVILTNFSWTKTDGQITLSLSGVASDRQSLVTFRDNLSSSGYFSNVTLPVSDLAKDRDINFQIKFLPL